MKKWTSHDTADGDWVVDMPHDPECTVQQLWFGDILRELAWIVTQYDDTNGSAELSRRLYDVVWTARQLLAKARGEVPS